MGPYLTVPKRDKDSVDGENPKVGDISYIFLSMLLSSRRHLMINICIVEIRSYWNVGMAQHHGGFTHYRARSGEWDFIFRSL
jgi:hypothetical protein